MTFEQLLYVEILSQHHSLQKAADVLHISKSGLSLAISQLEDEVGFKIFNRTSKGSILTPEGIHLMSSISNVLQSKAELDSKISHTKTKDTSTSISIEYVNTMLKPFITTFLKEYEEKYKNTYLSIVCNDMNSIIQRVRNKEIDAGFIAVSGHQNELIEDLIFKPVCQGKILLAVSKDNPLIGKKITLEDLKQQKFCLYNDAFHDYLLERLQFMCGPLNIVFRTDDPWTMEQAIINLNAVCFGRSIQWKLSRDTTPTDIVPVDIGHLLNDNTTLGWVMNPRRNQNILLNDYIESVSEEIKECL